MIHDPHYSFLKVSNLLKHELFSFTSISLNKLTNAITQMKIYLIELNEFSFLFKNNEETTFFLNAQKPNIN
jgi:ribosome biogenesis protein Nip4